MSIPPKLVVRLTAGDSQQVIVVSGEVDCSNAKHLRRLVDRVLESTDGDVLVDLSQVPYLDSTGLSVLLEARDALTAADRGFALRNPSAQVVMLLSVCGLTDYLDIVGLAAEGRQPVADNVTPLHGEFRGGATLGATVRGPEGAVQIASG